MKNSIKIVIKVLAIILAFALIISSVFIIRSCSAPPEYEEIRERVEELIERSFDVNDIVWGKGLPTYERVEAPKREFYESGKTYLDENGKEQPLNYYYYYLPTSGITVVAFRKEKAVTEDFRYAFITSQPIDNAAALSAIFSLDEGETAPEGLYTEIFADADKSIYAYLIPYREPEYDFYYVSSDPADYDYVRADSKYASVDAIKDYVRTVYAPDYADSLDQVLFDGVMEGDFVQKARYTTLQSSRGSLFASLNTYKSLFTERRVYMLDTAKIDRGNSNQTSVVVEFSTYMPSDPDKIELATLSFVLEDGVWYLASPTY